MLIQQTGVTLSTANATPGYVLIGPGGGAQAFLIDYDGNVINEWHGRSRGLTHWCYLLPNGNLFANERCEEPAGVALTSSGVMREYDWAGNVVFEHIDPWQHHDARRLANGNTVYLAFTDLNEQQRAEIKGGVPGSEIAPGIMGECVREVDANGAVVWEWPLSQLSHSDFPIHVNANRWSRGHTNTVCPLPDAQYLISCKNLNLIFIIDKKTGKMVWHYQDDAMGGQHDAQMLDNGNILLFANGAYSADLHHSQVWELNPDSGEVVWRYLARDNPQSFFSPHIGGCQRLKSGNTLICEGAKGCVFEVTPEGEVVWEYVSPYLNETKEFGKVNWLFRARHYSADCEEIVGRVKA
jgi:hypothetical protein